MKKIKPKTPLTSAILTSLITKTVHLLRTVNDDNIPDFYAGKNFFWSSKPYEGEPHLKIICSTDTWNIWWNGKFHEKCKVWSNIKCSAEEDIQYFIHIESILIPELSEFLENWEKENAYKVQQ